LTEAIRRHWKARILELGAVSPSCCSHTTLPLVVVANNVNL